MSKNDKNTTPTKKRIELRRKLRKEPLGERLPYPGGFPVYLSRYVLFGGDNPCAAMRFFNASDVFITGIVFNVTEKDADGRIIAEYSLERRGLFVECGTEFAVSDAPVHKNCATIEAALEKVISDSYEYAVDGDGINVRYGAESPKTEYTFKKNATYSVKKEKRKYVFISVLWIILIAVATLTVSWRMGLFNDVLPNGLQIKSAMATVMHYVETWRYN